MKIIIPLLISLLIFITKPLFAILPIPAEETVISITLQDANGKAVATATLTNQSKHYALPFNAQGILKLNEETLSITDKILITSVGYKQMVLSGKDLMVSKKMILILVEDIGQLKTVTIRRLKDVTIYGKPEELKFQNIQDLPFPLQYQACVTDKEFAYTIGGLSGNAISKQVLKYDPGANTWSLLTNKIKPVIQAAAAYIPSTGKIYVIGGLSSIGNFSYFRQVEIIDVKTGEVKVIPVDNPLPTAYAGSAVWNNKIYIFGGTPHMTSFLTGQATNAFYEFDPLTEKFTELPDMPESVQTSGAIVDGILYVFGGYNASQGYNSNNIYAYDISRKTWEKIGKMPSKNGANGISTAGPLIFMTGGYHTQDFSGYLDTRTNRFTMIKSNLAERRHSGAVILYNRLMVIGGADLYEGRKDNQVANLTELIEKNK